MLDFLDLDLMYLKPGVVVGSESSMAFGAAPSTAFAVQQEVVESSQSYSFSLF